jgi:hypothetical protein
MATGIDNFDRRGFDSDTSVRYQAGSFGIWHNDIDMTPDLCPVLLCL